jgi:hypothetical protein
VPTDRKDLLDPVAALEVLEKLAASSSRKPGRHQYEFVIGMTPETAAAAVDVEHEKAEAERHRTTAVIRAAEEATRQAEQQTRQAAQVTAQSKEATTQSAHRLWRVVVSCLTLGGGIIGCVIALPAAVAIAGMVGGVLTVAVGGSYVVEAIGKSKESKKLPPAVSSSLAPSSTHGHSAGKPPPGGSDP